MLLRHIKWPRAKSPPLNVKNDRYSLNDTIVIFDRIRENMRGQRWAQFAAVVNTGVNQTLSRTLLTTGSTLLVVVALLLFGGDVLHDFAFALLVGMVAGTYSTIFIANPLLVYGFMWREVRATRSGWGQLIRHRPATRATATYRVCSR